MSTIAVPIAFQTRLVRTELNKGLRLMWRRRSMVVAPTIVYALTYLGISLFIGGRPLVKDLMVRTLPALLAVVGASRAPVGCPSGIPDASTRGPLARTR